MELLVSHSTSNMELLATHLTSSQAAAGGPPAEEPAAVAKIITLVKNLKNRET